MDASLSPFANLIFACAITAAFVIPFMRIAKKLQIVSMTDFRRNNKSVPLVGGVCIFLGCLITCLAQGVDISVLLFALPVFLVGVVDDRLELGARPKFAVQSLAVAAWLYFLSPGELVLDSAVSQPLLAKALTWYWMIGLINAMNMIDGMDGTATGFSGIAAAGLYFLAPSSSHGPLLSVLVGACIGFLFFNMPKAKAYLGDAGSTTLGFILGAIASTTTMPGKPHSYIAILFVFAFPLMDAVLSIFRRILRRSNLFKGDRDHIHHKLQKVGCTIPQALMIIYLTSAYCSAAAYLIAHDQPNLFKILLPVLLAAPMMLLAATFFIESRLARQMSHLSKSLLLTHLPVENSEFSLGGSRHAIMFDLITYYKELQNRGFLEVNTFINDYGELVKTLKVPYKCYLFGAYTIVLTFDSATTYLSARKELALEFKALLMHNSLLKNSDVLPLGMKFYAPDSANIAEIANLAKDKDGPSFRRAG